MKGKSFIFIFVLIFMMVFSLGVVCAENSQSTDSDVVSGDVVVETTNPWRTNGELTYDIPADADIKQADVYVNVYSGSAQNYYGANANVTLKTVKGENQIGNEELWTEEASADGEIYTVNDHINKCYSDYQLHYDVTDSLKGLGGSSISIKVDTFKMDGKQFDGRIKLIALVLAYDDGDLDKICYYIDSSQRWTNENIKTTFETSGLTKIDNAELVNIALSSGDGTYRVNGIPLGDAIKHTGGNYYQYNKWDVTDYMELGSDTELTSYVGTSAYNSLKNVLSVLKVQSGRDVPDVTFNTEYTSVPTCYAGTNNTVTITVNYNKKNTFTVELLADGVVVNRTQVKLDGEKASTFKLTDPTIRPVDETTVNGADNKKVTYLVNVKYDNEIVNSANKTVPVLYNGNLGYDMEYDVKGFEEFGPITVAGDVVIDVKDASSYLSASTMSRTDVWTTKLDSNSVITNGYIYVPYNWFNAKDYVEDVNMFKATFNNVAVAPIAWYRDQGNLGNYGKYGYGVFVYDVSDLIKSNGQNTFVLKKANLTPAVYPSVFVYMYNTTGSRVSKTVYILNGADLLANSNNNAGRIVKADTEITVDNSKTVDAMLYVLAAGAQAGEGDVVFNGDKSVNVWKGTSQTTDLFTADVTSLIEKTNSISFVATGSTILALPQLLVVSKEIIPSMISITKVNGSGVVSGVLKGVDNKPIANEKISYTIAGKTTNIKTDKNGAFVIQGANGATIDIKFDGNLRYSPASTFITLENLVQPRIDTIITVDSTFTRNATDFDALERGAFFYATLTDVKGNPLKDKIVQIAINGKIYNETTDKDGKVGLQINLAAANTYTYALAFQGDDTYNAAPLASSKLTVIKKTTSISASSKTFKSTAKTKQITVTLKTIKNKYDGKTYLKSGKKITLKVNGVTYTAKINDKGQATFSIKLTKKGKFTASINFAGDKTYEASSKKITVTIK